MKTFFSVILALFTFAGLAKADRILVYEGYQQGRVNAGLAGVQRFFYLFDLDTLQSASVSYVVQSKTYSTGASVPFTYNPIATRANDTQTYFDFSSITTASPFDLNYGSFYGNNTRLVLGGSFVGDFPARLGYTFYSISGNGTTAGDTVSHGTGLSNLNFSLTRASNASNDNLATALSIVTQFLAKNGYTP